MLHLFLFPEEIRDLKLLLLDEAVHVNLGLAFLLELPLEPGNDLLPVGLVLHLLLKQMELLSETLLPELGILKHLLEVVELRRLLLVDGHQL